VEECLPYFLVRVFVVASRIVKRAKQFIPPTLFGTALHQLGQENPHRVVVGNREPMRMLSHDYTSVLQIVSVLARIADESSSHNRYPPFRPLRTTPVPGISEQSAVFSCGKWLGDCRKWGK
jgi:hypothetical protein